MDKTLVMKILDQKKIPYTPHYYEPTSLDAVFVATTLNQDVNRVFKTLVTKGKSNYYVFLVPANKELDLKKAAKFVNEKAVEMIKQKELEPLTGYIHGGCSPIGMKKKFVTIIDEMSKNYPTIFYSAGRIGAQVETTVQDLAKLINARFTDLIK